MKHVVLGAGGHAKVVIDLIQNLQGEIACVTDANPQSIQTKYPIYTDDALPDLYQKGITCAAMGMGHVGNTKIRNKVYQYAKQVGYEFPVLIHPSASVASSAKLGEGTVCFAQSVVNADAQIGRLCIINSAAVVEHEVCIGDGAHIAVHASVLGAASVGDNTLIGAGSVVLQGVHVGKNCIIGAGAVVREDVPDGSIVVGVPGRVRKRSDI